MLADQTRIGLIVLAHTFVPHDLDDAQVDELLKFSNNNLCSLWDKTFSQIICVLDCESPLNWHLRVLLQVDVILHHLLKDYVLLSSHLGFLGHIHADLLGPSASATTH